MPVGLVEREGLKALLRRGRWRRGWRHTRYTRGVWVERRVGRMAPIPLPCLRSDARAMAELMQYVRRLEPSARGMNMIISASMALGTIVLLMVLVITRWVERCSTGRFLSALIF